MAERAEGLWLRRGRSGRQITRVKLSDIAPNPAQPRKSFSENAIVELAGSIRRYGLLSPLIVRKTGPETYELVAGERRLRALRLLGENDADAVVLNVADRDSALIALIENLQRENLSFFEEAEACQTLLNDHGLSREELSGYLSKSPSAIANRLRLLKLPPSVRAGVCAGGLSERHARALLRLTDEQSQLEVLDKAIRGRLNVRSLEQLIEKMLLNRPAPQPRIRSVCRDHRLFVNAMLDTVRTLQESGAGVTSTVIDRTDAVEITVVIPRRRA